MPRLYDGKGVAGRRMPPTVEIFAATMPLLWRSVFLDLLNYGHILCAFYYHVSKIFARDANISRKDIDTSPVRVYTVHIIEKKCNAPARTWRLPVNNRESRFLCELMRIVTARRRERAFSDFGMVRAEGIVRPGSAVMPAGENLGPGRTRTLRALSVSSERSACRVVLSGVVPRVVVNPSRRGQRPCLDGFLT
jgi:hypothetical protein